MNKNLALIFLLVCSIHSYGKGGTYKTLPIIDLCALGRIFHQENATESWYNLNCKKDAKGIQRDKVWTQKEVQTKIPELTKKEMQEIDQWVENNPEVIYTVENDTYIFHYMFHTLKAVHEHNQKQKINIEEKRWTKDSNETSCGYLAAEKAIRYQDPKGYLKQDIGDGFYGFPKYRGEHTSWGGGKFQRGDKVCVIKLKKGMRMLRFNEYQNKGFWYESHGKKGVFYLHKKYQIDALELPSWPLVMVMNVNLIDRDDSFYLDFEKKHYQGIELEQLNQMKQTLKIDTDFGHYKKITAEEI